MKRQYIINTTSASAYGGFSAYHVIYSALAFLNYNSFAIFKVSRSNFRFLEHSIPHELLTNKLHTHIPNIIDTNIINTTMKNIHIHSQDMCIFLSIHTQESRNRGWGSYHL